MSISSILLDGMRGVIDCVEAARHSPLPSPVPAAECTRLLEEYRRTRAITSKLANRLVGKIPKNTLDACARTLGMMVRGTLVFDDINETDVLMDYCIFFGLDQGATVISRFAATSPYPEGSAETLALQAMCNSKYRFLAVTAVAPSLGIEAVDLLRNERRLIADESFSRMAVPGLLLASRIVDMPEFSMTTGAALPVTVEVLEEIWHQLDADRGNINSIDPKNATFEQEVALATLIISAALKHRTSCRIRYVEPGKDPGEWDEGHDLSPSRPGRLSPGHRVSRNDPCPCGSNLKYKNCCGRRRYI
ncbi:MAG TPA: SEC-C domain-containing protein [Phycisphaerae bacterium]|nr:SEC-C domain-containing protein [Phycisphaerae bacterium]HRR86782.1 SEC-C domain-containing protein [Phycisphaerae bacterium]